MLISHLTPTLGMERCALRVVEDFPRIRVVCIGEDVNRAEHLAVGAEVLGDPVRGWRRLLSVVRLRRWAGPNRQTVLAVGVWAAVPLLLSRRKLPFPVIVWEHSLAGEKIATSPGLRLLSKVMAFAYRRADLVVCVSDDLAGQIKERVTGVRVVTIPNYLPTQRLKGPSVRSPRDPGRGVGLLTVGSLSKTKNHELLLRAMARLPSNYLLVIAGEGELRSHLQDLAENLNIADRIDWRGHVDSMAALYVECDVVVQPALGETFGMAMFEAANQQRPVVALDFPHARSVVPTLVPGLLVESNVDMFAGAITTAATAQWSAADFKMAQAAREKLLGDDIINSLWSDAFLTVSPEL